jgi:amidohydrolase
MSGEKINAAAAEAGVFLGDTYRHLHAHPQLSFKEDETAAYIAAALREFHIECREHYNGQNGILARLKGKEKGPVLAFRADFDALSITEKTGAPFQSVYPGVMHACGHDGHTAILLALARCLASHPDWLVGEVFFIFQDAEENPPGGAFPMVKAGCMEGVDKIYALHMSDELDTGTIGAMPGTYMANADLFHVRITGRSGHGSRPADNQDTISAACAAITQINTLVSRFFDSSSPVVISVCNISGGNADNVMPPETVFGGTVRTFTSAHADLAEKKIEAAVKGACQLFDTAYDYEYVRGYPVLVNTERETGVVESAVGKLAALGRSYRFSPISPTPVAEDFSYYLQKSPGCFFRVGIRNREKGTVYPLHSNRFAIDEDALRVGFETMLAVYFSETGQL